MHTSAVTTHVLLCKQHLDFARVRSLSQQRRGLFPEKDPRWRNCCRTAFVYWMRVECAGCPDMHNALDHTCRSHRQRLLAYHLATAVQGSNTDGPFFRHLKRGLAVLCWSLLLPPAVNATPLPSERKHPGRSWLARRI
jgi:hypothetical protein